MITKKKHAESLIIYAGSSNPQQSGMIYKY